MLSPATFAPETVGQITNCIVSSIIAQEKIADKDKPITKDDYLFEKSYEVLRHSWKRSVRVIVYAPKVFYQIRSFFGVTEDEFKKSWTLSDENLKTKEGAGRSGSLFCHSEDKRYIFKTVFEDEKVTLLNFLPSYEKHITENPSSLLQRIYGLYYFEHIKSYVLVFGNLLFSEKGGPIEIFDLKGREVKPGHADLMDKEKTVFKDKNLKRKFRFSEKMREQLFQHLKEDAALLKTANIMDYSLLIGVRRVPVDEEPPASGNNQGVSVFQLYDGGFRPGSSKPGDLDEVFHIGIIDCLTNYGLRKKFANMFKSMRWKQESLSTVDAEFYANRFLTYMEKFLVDENSPEAEEPPQLNTTPPVTQSSPMFSFFSSSSTASVDTAS